MDPLISSVLETTVKTIVEKSINSLLSINWSKDHDDAKLLIEQLNEGYAKEQYLLKHVNSVIRIRTLHKADHDTYLENIYFPLKLRTASNNDLIVIDDNITIESSRIVNIIGIAGQGKSTILRKLFNEELKAGKRLPLFIELRNVYDGNIINEYKKILKNTGLILTEDNAEILLQSKKIILLLDGFDEVKTDLRMKVLNSIKDINSQYNCSIITTTRPNTEIHNEPNIQNLYVENLIFEDKIGILKILSSKEEFNSLAELLSKNKSLEETIINPILVTLLYYCFPYWEDIPSNTTEFYSKLFTTLYNRHDSLKNFAREKLSTINSVNSSWCFSALCFFSLIKEKYEFNFEELVYLTKQALHSSDLDTSQSESLASDIINITCLIQLEGCDRYVFLHKSIQEYYAARAIYNLPIENKKDIYREIAEHINITESLDNMLNFLFIIDKESYIKNLTINAFENLKLHEVAKKNDNEIKIELTYQMRRIYLEGTGQENGNISVRLNNNLDSLFNIKALNIMGGKDRCNDNELNNYLTKNMVRDIKYSELEKYKYTKKEIKSNNDNEPKVKLFSYKFELYGYLCTLNLDNEFINIYSRKIKEYFHDIYTPAIEKRQKRSFKLSENFKIGNA